MSERITDQQVADLIAILRTDASVDAKVQQVTAIKSSIKQHNVPDSCIQPVFEALRTASSSQHAVLVNAGFTSINHLFTRLARQEPRYLTKEGARTLPLIIEKLGDSKEKFRQLALQALGTLYKWAPLEVERSVRNTAMVGKNARAKEASMHWLLQMHQEQGLQFRAYVPILMELLEDADPTVREMAKTTVIELFRNAPNAAKSDLKKQLKNFKVRPAIEQAIVKELNPTSSAPSFQPDAFDEPAPARPALAASVSSLAVRPKTPNPPTLTEVGPEPVEPSYVNTSRELDEILKEMHFHFEGRETEQNWLKREESITKLRRLVAGNAATDFRDPFLIGLKALLDGIIKAITSLRTSLSSKGCFLIQEVAKAYGPTMDPLVELLMQTFVKLTAATKKISAAQAHSTVDIIISRVTYNARLMQHIWGACQDKNVQPRLFSAMWLKTLLKKEAHHKSHVEHTGGLDLIEKCIKKGLGDANPGVRTEMRGTYWTFAGIWPARAEAIMSGLDATAVKLLQKDPNNPNSPKKPEGGARPGLGLSKSTMGPPKPSVREAMLAQKRAMTAKAVPARPGSAMAHFSPVRTVSGGAQAPTAPVASTIRTRPESTVPSSMGGLSGAPMRPGRRRPEMTARPATAGPYSVRSHDQPSVEQNSPPSNPRHRATTPKATAPKAATPKSITSSPKRTIPKTARPCQLTTASESHLPTPGRAGTPKLFSSPRTTPSRSVPPVLAPPTISPLDVDDDFTLIVPPASVQRSTPSREEQRPQTPVEDELIIASPSSTPSRIPKSHLPIFASPRSLSGLAHEVRSPVITPPRAAQAAHFALAASVASASPRQSLEVYEDPLTRDEATPPKPTYTEAVLEDRPINQDAALLQQPLNGSPLAATPSPEKLKQNLRLLDSGISKVQQKSLDVHGFRKLQGVIRDNSDLKTSPSLLTSPSTTPNPPILTDDKFDALVTGLFDFLESPLPQVPPEKTQDVKAQVLATIKLLLRRMRSSFHPHVSRGLESLLRARAAYDGRTHMVGGLELLASELAALGDAGEIVLVLCKMLAGMDVDAPGAGRTVSMGLHVLKDVMEEEGEFVPSEGELDALAGLAARCLESLESAVRMDAVLLCVALHARVGDARFWEAVRGVREDPKSLITYYIVKRQRESGLGQAA